MPDIGPIDRQPIYPGTYHYIRFVQDYPQGYVPPHNRRQQQLPPMGEIINQIGDELSRTQLLPDSLHVTAYAIGSVLFGLLGIWAVLIMVATVLSW